MSCPSMPHYYGSASNQQPSQREYRAPQEDSSAYQTSSNGVGNGRQGQYGTNSYEWSGHARTAPTSNTNHSFPNDPWQERSGGIANPNTQQRPYYASSEPVTTAAPSYSSRDTYSRQNNQGLSNLAYASGLENQAPASTNVHPSQGQVGGRYTSSGSSSSAQYRVGSPAQSYNRYPNGTTQPQRQQQLPPPQPHYVQSENEPSSEANQHLALDAAAALAGVMQGQYQQQNQNQNQNQNQSSLPDPARDINTPQRSAAGNAHSLARSANHRSASPYSVVPSRDQGRQKSIQSHTGTTKRAQTTSRADQQRPISRQVAEPQPRIVPTVSNAQQETPASNPSSIANLVSAPEEPEQAVYETAENQSAMPNYIDPTQVFNPYHREHERKKREAAEAEAMRKAEEENFAAAKQKAADDASKKSSETSATANSKLKLTKKSNVSAPVVDNRQPSQTSSTPSAVPMPQEEIMANEMKLMMSKMKEFRTTNPTLFQKLWNDMRSSGTANTNAGASTIASATTVTQSPSPQVTQASLTPGAERAAPLQKTPSSKPDNSNIPSSAPRNGFRVIVENNSEGLPDLGRFPAKRRIRHTYAKGKSDKPAGGLEQDSVEVPAPAKPIATTSRLQDPANVWPEPRRRAVANAAVQFMHASPENTNIQITSEEISSILEQNPSYMDLCTTLEQRGFKLHRSSFARELLKSVPELSPSAARAPAPANQEINTITSIAQGQPPPPPVAVSSAVQAPGVNQLPNVAHPLPAGHVPNGQMTQRASPVFLGTGMPKSEPPNAAKQVPKASRPRQSAPSRPEPPIGSKEAAARKRDFSELIDLTNLDANENYVLPRKEPHLDTNPVAGQSSDAQKNVQSGFINGTQPLRFNPQSHQPSFGQPRPTLPTQAYPAPFYPLGPSTHPVSQPVHYAQTSSIDRKVRTLLTKKVDKLMALQKTYYDPKTVARDVLIASGRHPSERPLNVHLAGLLGRFLETDSDLSTFDWDSIDPGGPPVPFVEYVTITAPRKLKIGKRDQDKLSVIDKMTREPKEASVSLSARDALSLAPSPALPPRSSDSANNNHNNKNPKPRRSRIGTEDLQEEDSVSQKISIDIPLQSRSSRSVSHINNEAKSMEIDAGPSVKRRGRPFGSKNKNPSFAGLKQQAQAAMVETAEEVPAPVSHSYKCKWIKCTAELHNLETLKRHISKKHNPSEENASENGYICWWKKCQFLEPDEDGKIVPVHTFEHRNERMKHIEEDHVNPIAAKFGDGPRTDHTGKPISKEIDLSSFLYKPSVGPLARSISHTDPQSIESARTRYLSDEHGRMATPPVTSDGNANFLPDSMVLTQVYPPGMQKDRSKADTLAQNAFMKARGNKRGDTRKVAEEVVRAMESRKQTIGPGIDRGGCTLINEARRSTFIQSPSISRVVDGNY